MDTNAKPDRRESRPLLKAEWSLGLPSPGLVRPDSVEVINGSVRYAYMGDPLRRVPVPATLLEEFCQLTDATAPEEAVRAFVARYGGLGLCPQHHRPFWHQPPRTLAALARRLIGAPEFCEPWKIVWSNAGAYPAPKQFRRSHEEPIGAFLLWARRFRLLVLQAVALKAGGWTTVLDMAFMRGEKATPSAILRSGEPARRWPEVADILSAWLQDARVTLRVTASAVGGVDVSLASAEPDFPLFGELAVQALGVVASARPVETCDGCGMLFAPVRQRAAQRRKFCPKCGLRAAYRVSKRQKRVEERQQRAERERARAKIASTRSGRKRETGERRSLSRTQPGKTSHLASSRRSYEKRTHARTSPNVIACRERKERTKK